MNEENAGYGVRRWSTRRSLAGFAVGAGMVALSLVTTRSSMADPSTSDTNAPSSTVPTAVTNAAPATANTPSSVAGGGSSGAASGSGTNLNATVTPASPAVSVPDNQTGGTVPTGAATVAAGDNTPVPPVAGHPTEEWTWATFPVKLGLKFENVYDDNIYIRHSNRVGDFSWVMIPSLEYSSREIDEDLDALEEEPLNYLHFSYKPEFDRFLNQSQNNFIDQHVNENYLFTAEKLKLGLDSGFNQSHYPNVDFGGRLNATYYTARSYWEYDVTGRTTLGGDVAMTLSRYKSGVDTDEYTASTYLDYLLFPKTKLGLGTTVGYLELAQFQPHQDYGQFYARVSYQIRDKINLTGRVGVEYREYNGTANPTTTDPSFAFGVDYQPFDSTELQLEAQRRSVPSIGQNGTNYYDSDVALTWRQRIVHKVYFTLRTSYEHDDYYSVFNTAGTGLSYDYYTVRPSAEWDWNKYLVFNAYYEWQDNSSSLPFSGFYDNSVGIGAKFSY